MKIICTNCKRLYPESGTPYKCPKCGGLFDIPELVFDSRQVDYTARGIWRYRHTFEGLSADYEPVSLGEGGTPLLWSQAFGRQIAFKCEYLNPTGSFKDRGTSVITTFLKSRGVHSAVEDSSGNAGASFAAYAARAGMRAGIYTPEAASGPKRKQIEFHGANCIPSRELVRTLRLPWKPRLNHQKLPMPVMPTCRSTFLATQRRRMKFMSRRAVCLVRSSFLLVRAGCYWAFIEVSRRLNAPG